jgi:uncharacterized protein
MESVVITGASSGIGKALADLCISRGYHVLGVSRSITNREGLTAIACDLAQTQSIERIITPYIKSHTIIGLINCAGFGRFEPHEELSSDTIIQMSAINLTAPMLLSKLLLRTIKESQGFIINITSIEATKSAKFSALYSATKSGLRAFGLALFEEVRKSGVQVVTINPDMTDTNFFDELRFKPNEKAVLDTKAISKTVSMILDLPQEATITELTIRPQLFKIDKK